MGASAIEVIDYDRLVADFEAKLVTQLRGHGAAAAYLEMWVPDSDPVKSVLNMVEAASAYGQKELAIRLRPGSLRQDQTRALIDKIGRLGQVKLEATPGGGMLIVVTGIGEAL